MFDQTEHRPWPVPSKPWLITQTWEHLLFAHWPIPVESIRNLVPSILEIDTFDHYAWISVVPFQISQIRLRGIVPIPFSTFPELNVRTYVVYRNKPGVYFFSCDAASWLAVIAGKTIHHLPYYHAHGQLIHQNDWITFTSRRNGSKTIPAVFEAQYRPVSGVYHASDNSLDHWLTERYCLYTTYHNKLYRCDIHHLPWPLQQAEAEIVQNTLMTSQQIFLPNIPPIFHYAKNLTAFIWTLTLEND
ncbi:YqjF family protein [Thermoflavimicrobium dichotomicum]|uniref:DUF2071 domain-containing protein n=1 Tax=Thermoflavimicrobium dichotomicum TaxID=46223 RepID=A0A1I3TC75_9BACL|nr:DUF2071 domain-containing protein [Thermoflavimicrobium dichotomicum]SFJ67087.1 hypothetical protein SAMN05421852_11651 [Thermoflavimicrobium dichotomicum]